MTRITVTVGINEYKASGIRPLQFAEHDAAAFGEAAHERMQFEVVPLRGEEATRDRIVTALEQSAARLREDHDQLIFFFAGHGQRVGDHFALLAYDAAADDASKSLLMDELREIFSTKVKCGQVMCIFDACRSEGATEGRSGNVLDKGSAREIESLARTMDGKEVQVLFACGERECSYEEPQLEHGVLTYHLLSVLEETTPFTQLSFEELSKSAGDLVYDWVESRGHASPQGPVLHTPARRRSIHLSPEEEVELPCGMRFRHIRGGRFEMGSPEGEEGGQDWERPVHTVILSDFYMGIYPVTVAEFEPFYRSVRLGQWHGNSGQEFEKWSYERPDIPSQSGWPMRPVTGVCWYDGQAFCNWLSQENPGTFRLPSEAQWEYACRAGTKTAFAFGDDLGPSMACFDTEGAEKNKAPSDVGTYPPNAWGLSGMHGNTWEWCQDFFDPGFYGKAREVSRNPVCRKEAEEDVMVSHLKNFINTKSFLGEIMIRDLARDVRGLRGGDYTTPKCSCRSASRQGMRADQRGKHFGFRVTWTPESWGG